MDKQDAKAALAAELARHGLLDNVFEQCEPDYGYVERFAEAEPGTERDLVLRDCIPDYRKVLRGIRVTGGSESEVDVEIEESLGQKQTTVTVSDGACFNDAEKLRILALSEYYAAHAAGRPDVLSFREEVLGGSRTNTRKKQTAMRLGYDISECPLPTVRTLNEEEAYAFLRSPATRVMSLNQFTQWDIPVVGHEVQVHASYSDCVNDCERYEGVSLRFRHSQDIYVVRAPRATAAVDGFKLVSGEDEPPFPALRWYYETEEDANLAWLIAQDKTRPGYLSDALQQGGRANDPETLSRFEYIKAKQKQNDAVRPMQRTIRMTFKKTLVYPRFDTDSDDGAFTSTKIEDVWPGSILDELRVISESLAEDYHWGVAEATWFVLTGKAPWIRALDSQTTTTTGQDFNNASVTIKVLPWISLDTMHQFYKDGQRRLLSRERLRKGNAEKVRNSIAVFRFVTSKAGIHVNNKNPEWPALRQEWDSEHPGNEFRTVATMREHYNRAKGNLLQHDYTESMRLAAGH